MSMYQKTMGIPGAVLPVAYQTNLWNVILEDPSHENILYAGSMRGVYISWIGHTWSVLGDAMPGVAIADLEIHSPAKELIAATHGEGSIK